MGSVRIYPTPQYKYLRRDFADALLSEGAVRIGTLYDFRREEKHGSEIGDESEGITTVYSDDTVEWGNYEDAPGFYKEVLGGTPNHIRIEGIEFQRRHVLPDAYIYCTSEEFSAAAMEAFGCDTCVRIHDPGLFLDSMGMLLKDEITAFLTGRCIYTTKRYHHRDPNRPHPGFIKDPSHQYQRELRAVWVPRSLPIQPKIVRIPALCAACSLYTSL